MSFRLHQLNPIHQTAQDSFKRIKKACLRLSRPFIYKRIYFALRRSSTASAN